MRKIYNTYIYSSFVHKVFEISFNYKDIPELNRNRKMEEINDIIIKIYETKDINAELPSVLKEYDLLIQLVKLFTEFKIEIYFWKKWINVMKIKKTN